MILKTAIEKLLRSENLDYASCQQALDALLDPNSNPLQVSAFLVLLKAKPETTEELAALVQGLRAKMIRVPVKNPVLDIVGTGGDLQNTVNISTASALLAASCGVKVAKHGNRSVSSLTGSADVLEALGIAIQSTPLKVSESIEKVGIGFCYFPDFHPAVLGLRKLRKELNVPTTFNVLGPLLNPAEASHLLLGVAQASLLPVIADVLIEIGHTRAMVVHSMGLDEISCLGPTRMIEVRGQEKIAYILDPKDYGFQYCKLSALKGGDAKTNAALLIDTFKGKRGPIADTCILNAAVGLYLYGLHSTIQEAVEKARDTLYSGAVFTLLNKWRAFSHEK